MAPAAAGLSAPAPLAGPAAAPEPRRSQRSRTAPGQGCRDNSGRGLSSGLRAARGAAPMGKGWLVGGKWLGPLRGGGQGDREAQTQRQVEKRRLARQVARAAAAKPKSKGGRPQGPQKRRCSKITGVLPAKRAQCQKTPWMIRRRFRGKQTPMGVTVFARAAQVTVFARAAQANRRRGLS